MGCTGKTFADYAIDLLHLFHQRPARMKSAGSVHDDHVLTATDSRIHSVESDGRGIRAGIPANEIGAGALRPGPKLVDCTSAKRVGGAHEHRHLIRPQKVGELPDEGRLAGSIDADHQYNRRSCRCANDSGVAVTRTKRSLDRGLERLQELVLSFDKAASCLPLDLGHQTHRRRNTEVSFDENFFELFQRALNSASTGDRCDISERDVFYSGPERAGR